MINNQNIFIISHPRSGSSWFQECLYNHYNMNELFNTKNIASFRPEKNKLVATPYAENSNIESKELRSQLFLKTPGPKSVKIHWMHLDTWVRNWILKQQNPLIIFLERKSKEDAFKSLLIANHLKKFVGHIPLTSIDVDLAHVIECYDAIFSVDDFKKQLVDNFKTLHFYYEDLIEINRNDWFDPDIARILRQNSLEKVKIKNYNQIKVYLLENKLDVSDRRIF